MTERRLSLFVSTVIIASAIAGSSQAAEAANGWSGFYGGILGAYGSGQTRQDNTNGATTGNYDMSGWMFGVIGGHNWQSGSLVLGIEGDIATASVSGETFNVCVSQCYTELDWLATLRGRLGFDAGNFMPYLTAGVAISKLDAGTRQPLVPGQPLGNSDVNVGIAAGAGVEYALSGNTKARIWGA